MKSTKAAALACYDSYFGTLRNLNGGTSEENARMAPRCLEALRADAKLAASLAANPSKRLAGDKWLMESLTVSIPKHLAAFEAHYFPDAEVIPFPVPESPPAGAQNLPAMSEGMRLEWRVNDLAPKGADDLRTVRSHSQCLVGSDGAEIATIGKEAVDDVRALLGSR